jgi:transposase
VIERDRILIIARSRAVAGECPDCGERSRRVHSCYERRLLDLPSHGRTVQLRVAVRRFRCAMPGCPRRIFAEPLHEMVAGKSARRTLRLDAIVHHLGVALGGRPAASLARRLMLPVSKDTLLRVVRRHARRDGSPLHVIGIDDWASKRGQRYGSIICDLERRVSSTSSRIANPPQSRLGCRAILKFASSRATAAADMAKLQPGPHRRRCKLRIVGT